MSWVQIVIWCVWDPDCRGLGGTVQSDLWTNDLSSSKLAASSSCYEQPAGPAVQSMDPDHLFTATPLATPTPLSSFAQIIQRRSAMMRMRSEKATRALWKCETKRVWGRLVFTPGNAITPSRNSNLVSQTQFVFRPGEEI